MKTHKQPIPSSRASALRMTKLAVVGLAMATGNAFADNDIDGNRREGNSEGANPLPAIEVKGQAERHAKTRSDVSVDNKALPSAVTTITNDDLGTINVGRDMSNVFKRVPGVVANNIDQGDTGNGFRMRGFATQGTHGADTAVYVDGVPQNIPSSQGGAGHGPVFLEWLTPDMIDRIDVIKGPISALYGDQNRAGAVDMRTRMGGAVYYTLNQDEIVNTAPDVYQSVGDTTRKGFELETRYALSDAASVYLNYGRIVTP